MICLQCGSEMDEFENFINCPNCDNFHIKDLKPKKENDL